MQQIHLQQIHWRWYRLEEFSAAELYELCAARQAIFVVEQACAYQDLDGRDAVAEHLIGRVDGTLAASLRLLPPGAAYAEHSIGRVITAMPYRRQGYARDAMQRALQRVPHGAPVRIGAQTYLEDFYRSFGFRSVGEPYYDEGVKHFEMLKESRP